MSAAPLGTSGALGGFGAGVAGVAGAASALEALTQAAARKPIALPSLRDELRIFPGSTNRDGSPSWVIQDPLVNRFYRIGWLEFELLSRWDQLHAQALVQEVSTQTTLPVDMSDVAELISFLASNQLLRISKPDEVAALTQSAASSQGSWWQALVHNYLFFRLPLLRPQRAFNSLRPLLLALPMRLIFMALGVCAVLGIYLASRQWDVFTHTLTDSLTLHGLLGFGVALAAAKSLHELGHALTATFYGVRVGHMGVAFLVMTPMLYTDTGESWRLTNPRQRLHIASAGIVTELAIASLATLAWSLLPDGSLRNGCFFLATASWVATLAINASPFMRFDGYFVASDALDMPNLHERSGALARTWLRRTLLGWPEPWPESFTRSQRTSLIAFALGTWLYRLVLFLGIALLVYYFFFKVLGIVLMLVEIHYFILKPVLKEVAVWRAQFKNTKPSRVALLSAAAVLIAVLLFVPWATRVDAPGWAHAGDHQAIHAPFSAKLTAVAAPGPFKAGQALYTLDQPGLDIAEGKASDQASVRDQQLARLLGLPDGEAQRQQIASQRAVFTAEAAANQTERMRLVLKATFDGELRDVDPSLKPGVWVQAQEPLGVLVAGGSTTVDVFIHEADMARVNEGHRAVVWLGADSRLRREGRVRSIDPTRTVTLPDAMLDAARGGPIATAAPNAAQGTSNTAQTTPTSNVPLTPKDTLYRVRIDLDTPLLARQAHIVRARIDGMAEAYAARLLRHIGAVLVRESGF